MASCLRFLIDLWLNASVSRLNGLYVTPIPYRRGYFGYDLYIKHGRGGQRLRRSIVNIFMDLIINII